MLIVEFESRDMTLNGKRLMHPTQLKNKRIYVQASPCDVKMPVPISGFQL